MVIPHFGDPAPTLALIEQLLGPDSSGAGVVTDDASPTPFPEHERTGRRPTAENGGFGANVNSGAARGIG